MPALRRQQFPGPGFFGFAYPVAGADLGEAVGGRVEDRGVQVAAIAEIGAAERFDAAVGVADEDAVGVEDRDAELLLELLEESEHAIDGASRGFAALVDGKGEETAVEQLAGGRDRNLVRGPAVEKTIDAIQKLFALRFVQRW